MCVCVGPLCPTFSVYMSSLCLCTVCACMASCVCVWQECGDAAQRCCMSFPYISSCILCCGVSTRNFLPPHIAYVTQAHIKYAHHVLRTADYQSASGGSERGGRGSGPFKGSKLLPHDLALAHALKQALAVADPTPDKTRWSLAELTTHTHTVLAAMHTPV